MWKRRLHLQSPFVILRDYISNSSLVKKKGTLFILLGKYPNQVLNHFPLFICQVCHIYGDFMRLFPTQ